MSVDASRSLLEMAPTLPLGGETIRWRAGQRLDVDWSGKHEADAFLPPLEAAGLRAIGHYVTADERLVIALASGRVL